MSFVHPEVAEYEIEAEFAHEFIRNRSKGFAYTPIIASGNNANVLHYIENNQVCKAGDLILLDVAAEYANYSSDMTRTIPVSGRFTERQKAVYNAVLRVKNEATKMLTPGTLWKQYHIEVGKVMTSELLGELEDIIIFQNIDGSYELFNTYVIEKKSDKEYLVSMKKTHTEHTFYSMKNAVTWCIFDKRNHIVNANRILLLDNQLGGLEVDIALHTKIFKNTKNSEDKLIFLAKLNEDKLKKKTVTDELHTYINDSKQWQTKRFDRKPEH